MATLGELTRLTGTGGVFKYFNDFSDSFLVDLKYSLYSSFAFDCVLKGKPQDVFVFALTSRFLVRTSTGIRAHEYFGNFYSRSPNDIECAAINTNSNIAVEFKYDDKLAEDEHVVIQVTIGKFSGFLFTIFSNFSGGNSVHVAVGRASHSFA